jgi:hypothetical protein
VTRKGRDGLRAGAAAGRWSPEGEFEVLYISAAREGAIAEVGYRLSLEPVWPSRMEHVLHHIAVRTERSLRFADVSALAPLGVDPARYESFDYQATQAIAAAAHFLAFDGLIVPSARYACANLVIFAENLSPDARLELVSAAPLDWVSWPRPRRGV